MSDTPIPRHLRAPGKRLWLGVMSDFEVLDAHSRELLRLAAEAVDRGEDARRAVARDGSFVPGRYAGSVHAHPGLAVARDSATLAARLLRELGVDDVAPISGAERTSAARAARHR